MGSKAVQVQLPVIYYKETYRLAGPDVMGEHPGWFAAFVNERWIWWASLESLLKDLIEWGYEPRWAPTLIVPPYTRPVTIEDAEDW